MQIEKTACWITEPLHADVRRCIERIARLDDVQQIAVMPDVHMAKNVCIGTAIATNQLILPAAVGSDIGCGMLALRFEESASMLDGSNASLMLAALYREVPFNRHSRDTRAAELPRELLELELSDPRLDKLKHRDGLVQLGTLGRGNHFLEFQADEEGILWLMVHSGSRGMGQSITSYHLAKSGRVRGFATLDANSEEGQAYLHDLEWASRYAAQNRMAVARSVERMMLSMFGVSADHDCLIHANHNHIRRELHSGQQFLVHRKGTQSAVVGELGVIPGSMGTTSFHVEGRGCAKALCSSSHGAGRVMSRKEASRKITAKQLQREMGEVWYDQRRRSRLTDEAPSAYRDVRAVMRAQKELTRIVRQLTPVLSYKG